LGSAAAGKRHTLSAFLGYALFRSPKKERRMQMKRSWLSGVLGALLGWAIFCGLAAADTGSRAPEFSVRSLNGRTFSNASLRGRVVLLEFWATWCPHCRSDQAAVESMSRRFSGDGLVVVTVDVGEPESTVMEFLRAHPTSCPVALDQDEALSARFGNHGFPYYVVIDPDGYIAGDQEGAGGEGSLLDLLRRAGIPPHAGPRGGRESAESSAGSGGAKVIEVPRMQSSRPAKPNPKTVFIFANGERLEADHYTMEAGTLHVVVGGEARAIALSGLDMKSTLAVSRQRGIELRIPQSRSEFLVAF
jgi:thiol-disulfide isomerase/thioredoxin